MKGHTNPETLDYVTAELDNINRKQALIQQQIEGKNKEIATLRETLLVVSGALQGQPVTCGAIVKFSNTSP